MAWPAARYAARVPLHDHFRPPLSERRRWHSLLSAWATWLAGSLNELLPRPFFAEPNVQFGIEVDVAAFEEPASEGERGGAWTAPPPVVTLPYPRVTDAVEVLIYGQEGGPTLVGAVELVSPSNKDRPEHREAFVTKCDAYLQRGLGLVVVDVVTSRSADLLARVGGAPGAARELYASAYHPVEREGAPCLDVWLEPLGIGQPLPMLPLWLRRAGCFPLDLERAYASACHQLRIDLAASGR